MKCKICGTENPDNSKECSFCGSKLQTDAEVKQRIKSRREAAIRERKAAEEQTASAPQREQKPHSFAEAPETESGQQEQNKAGQAAAAGTAAGQQAGSGQETGRRAESAGQSGVYSQLRQKKKEGSDSDNKKRLMILIPVAVVIVLAVVLILSKLRKDSEPAAEADPYIIASETDEADGYVEDSGEMQEDTAESGEESGLGNIPELSEEEAETMGILAGTITDAQTGEAIGEARVILFDSNGNEYPQDEILTTDSNGFFSVKLQEEWYTLEIIKRGYADFSSPDSYKVKPGVINMISDVGVPKESAAAQEDKGETEAVVQEDQSETESSRDGYILPFSNERYLTDADLDPLSEWELKLARNEIYARHGRRFKDPDLQSYFDSQSWYRGLYDPEDFDKNHGSDLTTMEKKNAEYILQYELDHNYFT